MDRKVNKKAQLRKKYIDKHGECCETCDNNPLNRYSKAIAKCPKFSYCYESGEFPIWKKAKKIYSIDFKEEIKSE